ncbi:MAG: S8 family serine peptidase [Bacillota bacterium]
MKRKYVYVARALLCLIILTNILTADTAMAITESDIFNGMGKLFSKSINSKKNKNQEIVLNEVYGENEEIDLFTDIPQDTVTDAVYNHKNQIIVKYKDPEKTDVKLMGNLLPKKIESNNAEKNHQQLLQKVDTLKKNIKNELKLNKLETKDHFKFLNMDVLETEEKDIYKLAEELKESPDVEYVQPNYELTILATPTDPLFDQQWGLYNTGQEAGGEVGRQGVDINIQPAWDLTKGSQAVIVGVLDSGIDINHEDLKGNIYHNPLEIAGNGIDDDQNGYIDDVNGWDFFNNDNTIYDGVNFDMHGTAVAGVIGAASNDKGITGVAPNVKIMPLKFIHGTTGYTADAIKAIEYAMLRGVKIINCSFGGSDNNYALKDSMENSGILFIAAAGNRGGNTMTHPTYPACFPLPNIIGVASIDNKGVRSTFSGYGPYIDIAAPGEQIMTTMPENKYDLFTGTSASTPHVTGVVALLKSYEPNLNYTQITDRIMTNAVVCNTLQGKLTSNGRVDAYAVLSNIKPQPDTYVDPEGDPLDPGDNEFNNDSWYTMDQLAKIKEQIHYGQSGVNPATGNYSMTVNDMNLDAPGFQINISRTYNAKNYEKGLLGKGWTFGFEGSIYGENNIMVILPNGGVQMFKKLVDGSYRAEDNRSVFKKNEDNTYTLITKDQYTYHFNKDRLLTRMMDPRGNEVSIETDSNGKITKVTDQVGRAYQLTYNSSNLIEEITDPLGRKVIYKYQNNLLTEVTDPMGITMKYVYDSHGYLSEVKNHNNIVIQKLTYNHTTGYDQGKVIQAVDAYGSVTKYTYDTTNKKTTIVENNSDRIWTYWYDESNYITKQQNPEGREKEIHYYLTSGENKFGDIEYEIDEYGNKTSYEIDGRGNVTRITFPDGSTKTMAYDEKNNLIKETDQEDKVTYYIYDESKVYLLKVLRSFIGSDEALDGTITPQSYTVASYVYSDAEEPFSLSQMFPGLTTSLENVTVVEQVYEENVEDSVSELTALSVENVNIEDLINPDNFAITTYAYYTDAESQAKGWTAKGLLKSETDPENNTITYSYDSYGNIASIEDAEGYITTFDYNIIGWKLEQKTPEGYITSYKYNKNGQLIKVTEHESETKRIVYDLLGRKVKEIRPNQYKAEDDDEVNGTYAGDYGRRYEYYDNGLLKAEVDPMDNRTEYTYDVYGNIKTKTLPSGGIYQYTYDKLDRVIKVQFKEEAVGGTTTLEEYEYLKTFDNKKQAKHTVYLNHKDQAVTSTIYDYRDNITLIEYPDSTAESFEYFLNGKLKTKKFKNGSTAYYTYDPLDRLVKEHIPLDDSNGSVLYTYKAYTYDRAGRKTAEKVGVDGVLLDQEPEDFISIHYGYDKNGKVKEVQRSSGGRILYIYDGDGNQTQKEEYLDNQSKKITVYTYNHRNQIKTEIVQARSGDIYGNDFGAVEALPLTTNYTYDKNGNLEEVINAEGIKTTYEYDFNNNQTKIISYTEDAGGNPAAIVKETIFNFQGLPVKVIDLNGNITENEYDKRGFLIRTKQPLGAVTYYQYDLAGRKIGEVTPQNYIDGVEVDQMNRMVFTYDQMDRLKTKEYYYKDQNNQWQRIVSKTVQYNSMGQVTKEADALGYKNGYGTFMTYDLAGNLKTVLNPVSKDRNKPFSAKYEYDALGRKTSEINGGGVIINYEYDDDGNILQITRQRNNAAEAITLEENTYDYLGNRLTQKDANRNITVYTYNVFGSVSSIEYPHDSTIGLYKENYQYDRMGRLISIKDNLGKETTNAYDGLGRIVSKIDKGSSQESDIAIHFTYDNNGNKTSETDGNGHVRTYTYDQLNRLKSESFTTVSIPKTTQYDYDLNGNIICTTDWLGNQYTKTYDPLDRLIEEKDSYGKTIQKLTYNDNHLQIESIDALENTTEYQYDKNNRLIYTIDPLSKIEGISYDDVGNVAAKTDKKNRTTSYAYDESNNLMEVSAPDGSKTKYGYDLNGNLIEKTDGNDNTVRYEYNSRNLQIKEILHGGRTGEKGSYIYQSDKVTSFTYTGDGNLQSKIDPMGQRFDYIYDIHGRLTNEIVKGQTKKAYTYDLNSNILTMTDAKGTVVMTYDEENRLLTKEMPSHGIIQYTYDITAGVEPGEIKTTVTDPNGNVTSKTFDKAGRLKAVENNGETTQYSYNDNGSRKETIYPAGAKETYEYSKRGEITKLTNKKADGTIIDEYTYTYDDNGNQLTKTEKWGTTVYTYDSVNRLKEVQEPNGIKTTFDYDKAGNRTSQIEVTNGAVKLTNYQYNNRNQLERETVQDAGKTTERQYRYDPNGNLVSKAEHEIKAVSDTELETVSLSTAGDGKTDEITLFTYNEYNQMIKTITGNQTITYGYNIEGYRDDKTIITVNTTTGAVTEDTLRFIYDGNKVILETDAVGNIKAQNIYGLNLITRKADNEKAYYMYNAHEDVTALTDASGNVLGTYQYDAFGNIREKTYEKPNPYTYAGYRYDEEMGLYYLNARYYDPKIARFITEDTYRGSLADPLSLNLYTYVSNNPIKYYDPTGHKQDEYGAKVETVGLREAAEKQGGKVTWDEKRKVAVVKLNGKTKEYDIREYEVKDGRIQVSKDAFDKAFKKESNKIDSTRDKVNVIKTSNTGSGKSSGLSIAAGTTIVATLPKTINIPSINITKGTPYLAGVYVFIKRTIVAGEEDREIVVTDDKMPGIITFPSSEYDRPTILPTPYDNYSTPNQTVLVPDAPTIPSLVDLPSDDIYKGSTIQGMPTQESSAKDSMYTVQGGAKVGTGGYGDVGGHHIHAKAAFKGDINYDPDKGFSISQDFMKNNGWNHSDMTTKQRQLFKELYESGRANTLEEHTRIAKEALKAGGATEEQANELMNQSLRNLTEQGVTQPTRIPWYSK